MTPWVTRLIIANVAMFFVQMTASRLVDSLVFIPQLALIRPWTIITYMFLHGGIGHIFFNMLGLFFFGPRVEERLGSNRFFWMYMVSGIAGAVLSMFFAPRAAILGASGAVFGVMLAFAKFWPTDRIYIWGILPVEARVLVVITTLLALYSGFTGSRGGVADFAHLGGFVGAWLYLKWLDRSSGARKFATKSVARTPNDSLANWKKVDPTRVHEVNRDELNRILDKITKSGLSSLTPQERVFLSNFVPKEDRVPPPS
jgi:membrane associated rhomboid family serine protease